MTISTNEITLYYLCLNTGRIQTPSCILRYIESLLSSFWNMIPLHNVIWKRFCTVCTRCIRHVQSILTNMSKISLPIILFSFQNGFRRHRNFNQRAFKGLGGAYQNPTGLLFLPRIRVRTTLMPHCGEWWNMI